jgi:hypothetical protein
MFTLPTDNYCSPLPHTHTHISRWIDTHSTLHIIHLKLLFATPTQTHQLIQQHSQYSSHYPLKITVRHTHTNTLVVTATLTVLFTLPTHIHCSPLPHKHISRYSNTHSTVHITLSQLLFATPTQTQSFCCTFGEHSAVNSCAACILLMTVHESTLPIVHLGMWIVIWSELTWFMWSDFVLKWSEMSYGEFLSDNSILYFSVTLYWGYFSVLWLFHLVCILYCGGFNLFCNVWFLGNIFTCIYCDLLFHLRIIFLLFLSVLV